MSAADDPTAVGTRTSWRRAKRQALARLERLSRCRDSKIGADLYTTHVRRLLSGHAVIAATVADLIPKTSDAEIWRIAALVDMFARYEYPVWWHHEPKRSSGFRVICKAAIGMRVRQRLLVETIAAQQSASPQIFNWKGRGNARQAVQIKHAIEGGGQYVVVADVRDCFPSVKFDAVYDLDLLPEEVIRFASDSRYLDLVNVHGPLDDESDSNGIPVVRREEQAGPRGLLQGLGSSDALWVALINDLPERLSGNGVPFVYCDNIAVVCATSEAAVCVNEELVRYFSDHCAGPFSLTVDIHEAERGFEHTGYRFDILASSGARSVTVSPTTGTLVKLAQRLQQEVRSAGRNGISVENAAKIFDDNTAGFSAITDDWREEMLSSFMAEINANCPGHWTKPDGAPLAQSRQPWITA